MATGNRIRNLRGAPAVAVVAMVVGIVFVVVALTAQRSAPQPRSAGLIDPPVTPPTASASPGTGAKASPAPPGPLGPSKPTRISIPAIGVDTPVYPIGLAPDGTLDVPQPGPHLNNAAWFENSPTPGQPGPAIIEGHVDSEQGVSVFFRLGAIKPHDLITVRRADGTRLEFRVDAVRDFKKSSFPTTLVYGGKELSEPTLRLITCSDFDTAIHHHIGNEVVFAHLTKVSGRARS